MKEIIYKMIEICNDEAIIKIESKLKESLYIIEDYLYAKRQLQEKIYESISIENGIQELKISICYFTFVVTVDVYINIDNGSVNAPPSHECKIDIINIKTLF